MSPSLDGTMSEYVISQGNNSPLTLYIEFHNVYFFLDINSPVDQVQSQIHAQSSYPYNIPKYTNRGKMHFHKKYPFFFILLYSSIRQLYCCDITDISTVPSERAAYKKLTRTLKNHSS